MTNMKTHSPLHARQRRPRARVTGKFQVTIPASIRRSLGLAVGDVLRFRQEGEQVVVTVEPQLPDGDRLAREMGYAGSAELAEALEEGGRVRGEEARNDAETWMAVAEEAWEKVNRK